MVIGKYKIYHMVFTATAVKHTSQKQLSDNTAQGPHVDGCGVWNSQNDLWSPFVKEKISSEYHIYLYIYAYVCTYCK